MADSPNPSSGDLPAGSGGSPEKPVLADRRVAALAGAGAGARYKAMSPARLPISREPCLTIPAGFSPGALLDSPVLLNNFKVITAPPCIPSTHATRCYSGIYEFRGLHVTPRLSRAGERGIPMRISFTH